MNDQLQDENKLIAQRREKLEQLRENGNAFPNDFRREIFGAIAWLVNCMRSMARNRMKRWRPWVCG
jgi:lysyl-tRNA synthetase class II